MNLDQYRFKHKNQQQRLRCQKTMMFRNPTSILLVVKHGINHINDSFWISATTASSIGDDDLLGTTPSSDYDYEEPTPEPEDGSAATTISFLLLIIQLLVIFWTIKCVPNVEMKVLGSYSNLTTFTEDKVTRKEEIRIILGSIAFPLYVSGFSLVLIRSRFQEPSDISEVRLPAPVHRAVQDCINAIC